MEEANGACGEYKTGETPVLIITIAVDRPLGTAIGVKEQLAMDLERYGDTKVLSVVERVPEQIQIWGVV